MICCLFLLKLSQFATYLTFLSRLPRRGHEVEVLMKQIISFLISVTISGFFSVAHATESLQHTFHEGETLWFISLVYYGVGSDYKKIMAANHLAKLSDVEEGQKLTIPEPHWGMDPGAY